MATESETIQPLGAMLAVREQKLLMSIFGSVANKFTEVTNNKYLLACLPTFICVSHL